MTGFWKMNMNQIGATLERAIQVMRSAPSPQPALPSADWVRFDDDDVLDHWLALLSVDEVEHFLRSLVELL
jgi:hypothetical protein